MFRHRLDDLKLLDLGQPREQPGLNTDGWMRRPPGVRIRVVMRHMPISICGKGEPQAQSPSLRRPELPFHSRIIGIRRLSAR